MTEFEAYVEAIRKRNPTWEVSDKQCPECEYGALVRIPGKDGKVTGRWVCTAYGQCELSVG